jgi:hypothetical protein
MKNIYILPTDQPSRLYLEYGDGDLCLSNNLLPQTSRSNNQHIYITSDEEIKDEDYCIHTNQNSIIKIRKGEAKNMVGHLYLKKVILTTDPILIESGIQAIDDEFLEWFAKNPTCEFIHVYNDRLVGYEYDNYTIILPQEDMDEALLPKFSTTNELTQEEPKKDKTNWKSVYEDSLNMQETSNVGYESKIKELEQQIEKMFSEGEVKDIIDKTIEKFYKHRYADKTKAEMKELWFEQFKKK